MNNLLLYEYYYSFISRLHTQPLVQGSAGIAWSEIEIEATDFSPSHLQYHCHLMKIPQSHCQ